MSNVFTLTDPHGNFRGLKQALERSGFNYEEDLLITGGDITDGHDDVYLCVEELLKIKNRIDIVGNHDDWFATWLETGVHPCRWMDGGIATLKSYLRHANQDDSLIVDNGFGIIASLNHGDIPESHKEFFKHQINYLQLVQDDQEFIFVHGGFNYLYPIGAQHKNTLIWDRHLWKAAMSCEMAKLPFVDRVTRVHIGHTNVSTEKNPTSKPLYRAGVWNLDTGAGGIGKVTIMNVITQKYFQSDSNLYKGSVY